MPRPARLPAILAVLSLLALAGCGAASGSGQQAAVKATPGPATPGATVQPLGPPLKAAAPAAAK